jgi:flagellar hook-associated protein 2
MAVDYLSALNSKGSGLNITQIVDSLVQAEKTPQSELINNKITKNNTSISAIAEVKSALSGLSSSIKTLKGSTALTPTSNSTSITVEINDASKATTLDSSITVSSLAAGQTLAFSGFSSSTAIVGGGTLKLERGDWSSGSFVASSTVSSQDITVSSTDTLASLRDKINALNYGVTASIVGTGDGTFNLVLKSETGAENALRVTATESPSGSGLASIDNTSTNASKQKIAGVDASIVVDGITLTRSTNNITDLFEGYSVNLISTTSSAAKIVSSVDIDQAEKYLQTFVDAVNVIKKVFNEKTFRGSSSSKPGPLASDTVILGIKKRIESFFSSGISGFGTNNLYLSNLGVRTEKDNTLSLNSTILAKELKNNPATYDAIFNSMYSSGSSLLSVSGGTNKPPKAGSYTFAMTAFVAGAVTGLNDIDSTPEITSSNNTIQLTVDGTTSGTITVPASHYSSQGALATAIQTAINNDSTLTSAGKSVIVSYENSSYTIKSSSKGSDTSMVINAIGSNLDSFLKMSGSADTDNIGTSQSGTANNALLLNGSGVTATDPDGLVDAETLGSSGNFNLDGTQAGGTLNSHITITSSNNLSSVSFTITGTSVTGASITETISGTTAGGTVTSSKIFKTVTQISSNAAAAAVNVGTKAAFVDITGERASITSLGSDESSISFTVVGTDMSGVTQTEVITGPSANSTAIGSKTFQTISSITPNSNTTGSISLGFSGVGITTTGVTGSATLNGISMIPDVTNNLFSMASGDGAGLKVQYSGLGANANVFYGESSIDMITNYVDDLLSSSNSTISDRLSRLNKDVASQNTLLSDLDTQFESIRSRYVQQFSAMEQAVTSLKSTGSYLENLFKAMNKED